MLPWQQSAIYPYEQNWNPRCVPNLHCECQELKPKVETNTSFLVHHPFSGVDSVKTVGSHLKTQRFNQLILSDRVAMFTQAVGMTASDWSVSDVVKTRQKIILILRLLSFTKLLLA